MKSPARRNLIIAAGGLLLLTLVWQHIQATRLGYEAESCRLQARSLRSRLSAMEMEIETSLSPAQLALRARDRLGMIPASPEVLRVLGAPAPPASQEGFLRRLFARSRRSLAFAFQT